MNEPTKYTARFNEKDNSELSKIQTYLSTYDKTPSINKVLQTIIHERMKLIKKVQELEIENKKQKMSIEKANDIFKTSLLIPSFINEWIKENYDGK